MADFNDQQRRKELARKYLKGTITDAEQQEFDVWFASATTQEKTEMGISEEAHREKLLARIHAEAGIGQVRRLWPRIAAAASILLVLSTGGYFLLHKSPQPVQQIVKLKPGTFKNDALPGNKAILTLANGQKIAVANLPAGQIQNAANTNIQKAANGTIVYGNANETQQPLSYNTLTVPRGGGKHELRLADGTLAVLDAGSSIRFPVAFTGKDRKVEVTGQVYLEVVHNAKQPFYVSVNNQTIEDIGTHFNINAFDGEVKTTLLEGAVKVNNLLLKPGQQAVGKANGSISIINDIDEEEVIAWKNDLFKFGRNTSLQTVMNQLSRWYDMDIVYEGSSKTYHFGGDMPRYSKLSDVLKILAYNGVQFSVDGKKIIVYQ